jgi:hypothetical protein
MKVSEVEGTVNRAIAQVQKGVNEVIAKIKALEEALTDQELPEGATKALTDLATATQNLDDVVPDPIVVEPDPA